MYAKLQIPKTLSSCHVLDEHISHLQPSASTAPTQTTSHSCSLMKSSSQTLPDSWKAWNRAATFCLRSIDQKMLLVYSSNSVQQTLSRCVKNVETFSPFWVAAMSELFQALSDPFFCPAARAGLHRIQRRWAPGKAPGADHQVVFLPTFGSQRRPTCSETARGVFMGCLVPAWPEAKCCTEQWLCIVRVFYWCTYIIIPYNDHYARMIYIIRTFCA